jgi:membrane fusion protein, peptide pheromone/bacteriocin exporter
LMESLSRYEKVKLEYNRNQILHREQVIADAEFEDFRFKLDQAELALTLLKQTQLSQWQSQLNNHTAELLRIESDKEQLVREKDNLVIRSPITGSVQNLAGIYTGSLVHPNQELALISPDTSLIAEVLVSPNDIGLVRFQMPVKFQIDAFSYSHWGLASGRILEISNDVHLMDGKPVFKIQCSLSENYLELKNGYRGHLKKGMTLKARFIVTQRTLWQLLYDKVEDWLDPNA